MLRLRFHASWLPDEHNAFWTIIDPSMNIETIADLIRYFIEQEKSLANFYQFHLSKRMTKLKYIKAFLNDCVLPPHALVNEILRDNDQIYFHLEIDSQTEWLVIKSAPVSKPKQPKVDTLDQVLETIASTPFNFQFGNKRGRPVPPRPQVISSVKINSLVPRQVLRNKTSTQ